MRPLSDGGEAGSDPGLLEQASGPGRSDPPRNGHTMRSLALVMGVLVAVLATIAGGAPRDDVPLDDARHRVTGKIPFGYFFEEVASRAAADGRPIFAYFTFET